MDFTEAKELSMKPNMQTTIEKNAVDSDILLAEAPLDRISGIC